MSPEPKESDGAEPPPEQAIQGSRPGPAEPSAPKPVVCDVCGGPMLERHCKLVCVRCGYQRDCSDP